MYPEQLIIRDLSVRPPIIQAPLESITDLVFRRMLRSIGGLGMTFTEFVSSEGFIRDIQKVEAMAAVDPDERPVAVQIYGRRPLSLAEAARRLSDGGASVIDINMGCPARKVCAHSGGASLMREPALVRDIVRATRAATALPLTVKMRAGTDSHRRNAVEIARICQEEGADAVTVHGRTREDLFGGSCDLGIIAEVRAALSVPVIGNGDVVDLESARRMFDLTGCHAIMIGRGLVRDPFLGLRVARGLRDLPFEEPSLLEKKTFLLDYTREMLSACRTEDGALGRIKKFAGYYTHSLPLGGRLRKSLFVARELPVFLAAIDSWFVEATERQDQAATQDCAFPGP